YLGALERLAVLRASVDDFFGAVMVMVEEDSVRENRLSLLSNVALLASPIADFNKIVISG
ncbi:MAG: hypothetical protein HGA27_08625, partial [Peptococcaceae bacterium]|nr:hypothetical protein [Peptococcaceae bacterium]